MVVGEMGGESRRRGVELGKGEVGKVDERRAVCCLFVKKT